MFIPHSWKDGRIPSVINQEGDILGISQEEGQHFKWDALINNTITTTLWSTAASQIFVDIQTNVHLDI
jgi:hypothetical protein